MEPFHIQIQVTSTWIPASPDRLTSAAATKKADVNGLPVSVGAQLSPFFLSPCFLLSSLLQRERLSDCFALLAARHTYALAQLQDSLWDGGPEIQEETVRQTFFHPECGGGGSGSGLLSEGGVSTPSQVLMMERRIG